MLCELKDGRAGRGQGTDGTCSPPSGLCRGLSNIKDFLGVTESPARGISRKGKSDVGHSLSPHALSVLDTLLAFCTH
jgi:hypothetical protein